MRTWQRPALGALAVYLLSFTSKADVTIYVNGSCGDDAWSGANPACAAPAGPKRTLQAALAAAAGSTGTIVAAPGTYVEHLLIGGGPAGGSHLRIISGGSATISGGGSGTVISIADATFLDTQLTLEHITVTGGSTGVFASTGAQLTLRNCAVQGNGVGILSSTDMAAYDTLFEQNTGGAVRSAVGTVHGFTIDRCIFRNNSAAEGGAVFASDTLVASVANSVFVGNQAVEGGAVAARGGATTLANCTFHGNSASTSGGAVRVFGWPISDPPQTSVRVFNSIVWNSTSPTGAIAATAQAGERYFLAVERSDVQGGYAGGIDILNADPHFANAAGGDFHLLPGSPCIDAGDNIFRLGPADLDTHIRRQDDLATADTGVETPPIVDLGAYEVTGTSPLAECLADLDGDDSVSLADLATVLANFGSAGAGYLQGDLTRDGQVGLDDLAILLAAFGGSCPS